jgi:glycosyltransferase involved in cell wall biosynthesis
MKKNNARHVIGFCGHFNNPHIVTLVMRCAEELGGTVDGVFMEDTPSFRQDNGWKTQQEDIFRPSSPASWLRMAKWLTGTQVKIFWGAKAPFPRMPLVFFLACLVPGKVFLIAEGFRTGDPGFGGRLFLRLVSLVKPRNGWFLGVGNTSQKEYAQAGLKWPSRLFGFAESAPGQPQGEKRGADPGRPLRLLGIGQLIARKRWDWLVKAIAEHPCRNSVELRICGTGVMMDKIRELAAVLGVRVELMGFRSGEDLAADLRWADVLVHPAIYEGWGVVLNHAAYFGLPVIAYAGVRSADGIIVRRGETGFVFETPEEFASILQRCLSDRSMLMQMGEAAREIGQKWTPESLGSVLAELIRGDAAAARDGEPLGRGPAVTEEIHAEHGA